MAPVLFSNLHPDFKLGFLLVVAAGLLAAGGSNVFWSVIASDRLGLPVLQFSWTILAAGSLGGLLVVAAVIWVDSRPPHGMMAAGALSLAIGLALLLLSDTLVLAVPAAFISGAGGAAVGSLIFYSVAVKGHTRFKGALIGAISLVFNLRWDLGVTSAWEASLPIGWLAVILALAGGAIIFVLLPRWFQGPDGPGRTLRETMAVPGAKVLVLWAAAVYILGAEIRERGTIYLDSITMATSRGTTDLECGYQITALVGGIGALLWGISADYYPVRLLLITLGVLSLPAAGLLLAPDWQAVGMLLMWLVLGGLISLTWVLMAESLPQNHFAKLVLAITVIGYLVSDLELLLLSWANYVSVLDGNWFFWVVGAEIAVLAALVACRPGTPRTGG